MNFFPIQSHPSFIDTNKNTLRYTPHHTEAPAFCFSSLFASNLLALVKIHGKPFVGNVFTNFFFTSFSSLKQRNRKKEISTPKLAVRTHARAFNAYNEKIHSSTYDLRIRGFDERQNLENSIYYCHFSYTDVENLDGSIGLFMRIALIEITIKIKM